MSKTSSGRVVRAISGAQMPQEMGQADLVERVSINVSVRPRRNARATHADSQGWTQTCVACVVNVDLDVASRQTQAMRT